MLTIDALQDYFAQSLAEAQLQGHRQRLRELQQVQAFIATIDPTPHAVADIAAAVAQALVQAEKSQNRARLLTLQGLAGLLMEPAELQGDRVMFDQFRVLAAHAANAAEAIEEELEQGRGA